MAKSHAQQPALPGAHLTPPGLIKVKARKLRTDITNALGDVDRAASVVEGLLGDLEDLHAPPEQDGDTGPFDDSTIEDAEAWLDRQRLLGLITPEGAAAVERLIEDLR
jgi:hypothetical protein